jgi:broad specificity phosphatase PhoE
VGAVSGATPARRLWLVRHGETEGQSSIRFHGSNDVRLSDEGRAQVRALGALLANVPFARVVHSPLARAAESASILADVCGLPRAVLAPDRRLREICFGACEGLTEQEITAAFPEFWRVHRAGGAPAFPDGEPRAQFAARVRTAITELAAASWTGDVLVVAHRGTVRQALRALLRTAPGEPDAFGVPLASVSTVRDENGWQLEALGLLP